MSDIKSVIRARDELARIVGLREKELRELEKERNTFRSAYIDSEARLTEIAEYISCIDGLPGSSMWRLRTDIQAMVES